jgi:uncharacterized membrane protein
MQRTHRAGATEATSAGTPLATTPFLGTVGRMDRIRGLRRILIFDIAGPLIAYNLLRSHGASQVLALILAGALPAVGVLVAFSRDRALDVVGCVVLGGLLLSTVLGLVTHSPRAVLLEGAIVTAAFALSALASLFITRPLMFHFAQAAMGGQHTAGGQELNRRYDALSSLRRYFRIVTLVWGSAFVIEAAVKVMVIETSSTGFALTFTRVAPYPLVGVLLLWTIAWGRAIRRCEDRSVAAAA